MTKIIARLFSTTVEGVPDDSSILTLPNDPEVYPMPLHNWTSDSESRNWVREMVEEGLFSGTSELSDRCGELLMELTEDFEYQWTPLGEQRIAIVEEEDKQVDTV